MSCGLLCQGISQDLIGRWTDKEDAA